MAAIEIESAHVAVGAMADDDWQVVVGIDQRRLVKDAMDARQGFPFRYHCHGMAPLQFDLRATMSAFAKTVQQRDGFC